MHLPGIKRCFKILAVSLLLFAAVNAVLFAGGKSEKPLSVLESGDGINVFVSILPQKYFVKQIAGDKAVVSVMVPPGQSPHSYEPTPRQIQDLGMAHVYFSIGVDFEKAFLPAIASNLPSLPITDSSSGIRRRTLEAHGHDDDDYEEGPGHENPDPHVWLGLEEGKIIAKNILEGLTKAAPAHRGVFESNYAALVRDIDGLKKELMEVLAPVKGQTFLVFHPAFGYFADTFGINQEAIETGGTEPTPRQLEAIIEEALEEGVRVIFVQPQFAQKSAETIAKAIGGAVVPIDPLAPDWLDNLKTMADKVRKGLSGK